MRSFDMLCLMFVSRSGDNFNLLLFSFRSEANTPGLYLKNAYDTRIFIQTFLHLQTLNAIISRTNRALEVQFAPLDRGRAEKLHDFSAKCPKIMHISARKCV